MSHCILTLWHDEAGAVLTAELVIILTLVVLALVVGLSELASAINCELFDISYAIRGLNQSYAVSGFRGCWPKGGYFAGSRFIDYQRVNTCLGTGICGNGYASGSAAAGYAGGYGYGAGYGGDVIPGAVGPYVGANGALVGPGSIIVRGSAATSGNTGAAGTVIAPGSVAAPGTIVTPGATFLPNGTYIPGESYVPGANWQVVPGSTGTGANGQVCPMPNCPTETPSASSTTTPVDPAATPVEPQK